jgi:glutamate-ammonia-ligase adenylyltransferase
MALTRARVLTGPPRLKSQIEGIIGDVLRKHRDGVTLKADVRDMRDRIAAEKGSGGLWDLKQAPGGMVDIEFLTQYLQLRYAADAKDILDQTTVTALRKLTAAGCLDGATADQLVTAARFYQALSQILRLCLDGPLDLATAPRGLVQLLCRAGDAPDLASLEAGLQQTQAAVSAIAMRLLPPNS